MPVADLAKAVKGARHTPQDITWLREDGDPQDLTGATLTGVIRSATGTTRAIDGALSILSATAGTFRWTYGATDVGTTGVFRVQFTATYADATLDRTFLAAWTVEDAPAVTV